MSKYSLPNMEFPFSIQMKGKETGINWVGEFKYRRPTLGARSRIEASRARLSGDVQNVDPEVEDFNHMVSYLRHTLVEYPEWWSEASFGYELYDGNVVSEIYNKCMDFEVDWKKKIHSGNPEDVEETKDVQAPKEFKRDAGTASQEQ